MTIAEYPTEERTSASGDQRVSLNRVAALYRIGETLMQARNETQLWQTAARGLVEQAGYGNAWILTIDQAARTLQGRTAIGAGMNEYITTLAFPLANPNIHTTVRVAVSGAAEVVQDLVATADGEGWGDIAREAGLKSAVYVPFGTATQVMGVIAVALMRYMQPEEELTLLGLFASQLTGATEKLSYDTERAQQIAALQQATVVQERLLETVRELSTPAIPIYDGILVMPLVGNIDTGRAGQVMEAVLNGIAEQHAAVMILDVTGVPVIDTGVANHLVQITRAAQLLGARCLLVGIKPEVAQTLVQLGVDLSSIVTRANLQAGVAFALMQRGLRIVESRN